MFPISNLNRDNYMEEVFLKKKIARRTTGVKSYYFLTSNTNMLGSNEQFLDRWRGSKKIAKCTIFLQVIPKCWNQIKSSVVTGP